MTAWIVRAGRFGEREQRALAEGLSAVGWSEVGDLGHANTKDEVRAAVASSFPTAPPGRIANYTGQLWALRASIKPGDLIVMPLKSSTRIALGLCTKGYEYHLNNPDVDSRHAISVDWRTTDVSRAAIKDDLLNTINGAMTVFQASKNNAARRLHTIMETGVDPGNVATVSPTKTKTSAAGSGPSVKDDDENVVDPDPAPTIEAIRDRVRTHLIENFKGHRLTELVAAILRVEGYVCDVSPPGPDQGVDIIAGRGPH